MGEKTDERTTGEPPAATAAAREETREETPRDETRAERIRRLYLERKTAPTQYLDDPPPLQSDTLWRGLARNGEARVLVVRATDAVREAVQRLEATDDVGQLIGELMVATLLVRSTLNPEERMQVLMTHQGPVGQIVVDAWENGGIRVYVGDPGVHRSDFGFLVGDGLMQVARSQSLTRRSYRSTVALDGDGVDEFMMHYLLDSEQILSQLRVEVTVEQGEVRHAVGYLVQLMPEGTREDLQTMTSNLEALRPLQVGMTDDDPDARGWAEELMRGLHWDQCAREMVRFQCRCSEERILGMLSSLPRADLEDLAKGSEPLEMSCDYCKTKYHLRPAQVAVLLEQPS